MGLKVVPLYAAVLAILFIVLSIRVIAARRTAGVNLGTEGDADLQRRVRVHANCAEYAPFGLLLITMAELRGLSPFLLHVLCVALVFGRVAHALGVSRSPENYRFRQVGMAGTFTAIAGAAVALVLA